MANITPELVTLVNSLDFDVDIKHDFFVKYLVDEEIEFKNEEHMRGYVITALHNMTTNSVRVSARRKEIELERHDDIVRVFNMDEHTSDPADIHEALDNIDEKVSSLTPLVHDTLEDYYVKGMTPEEIAERDGDKVEAVRKRITRGRNTLKGE